MLNFFKPVVPVKVYNFDTAVPTTAKYKARLAAYHAHLAVCAAKRKHKRKVARMAAKAASHRPYQNHG